ncbi:MAG: Arc family DNA-binding protein [Acinetobacter ursingii]|uniref:Arc family DNA-binding protein n=2 Tax=Acinetobacter ursingii TaxID=108980 RepID=UPI0012509E55|nr:Arc family DNA-binding protein [Acinetobacter ursingii]
MGRNLADVEYKMRMTQDLKDKIVASAKEHNRSMNADIVARLEESFEKDDAAEFDKGFVLQVIESQQDQINQLQKMIQDLMTQLRGSKE